MDPTHLSATLPAFYLLGDAMYPITVTNPDATGAPSNSLNFTVSSSGTNPVPSISSISPNSASVGASAQTVSISGQNFLSNSTVSYNGVLHSATFLNSGQLTFSLSASDLTTAGSFPVVVTNPSPGGGPSNAVNFTVGNPIPAVLSLTPSSITVGSAAQTLTITGSNFLSSSSASFNGSTRTPTFINNTQLMIGLTVADIATAGTFPVSVSNPAPGGGISNTVNFTVSSANTGTVNLTPMSIVVPAGGSQTFTATVAGSGNGVLWSVQEGSAGGTIINYTSTSATYSPPSTTGTYHIVATSVDNSAKTSTATVMVTPALSLSVLHSFQGSSQGDGGWPVAGVVQASDGNFYGTTYGGGAVNDGTVFKVDAVGNLTTLYSFSGTEGGAPAGGLIQASDGNFYGTTYYGGTGGTVFKINGRGAFTVLHTFSASGLDGMDPYAGLVQASDGFFYGTTFFGGTANAGTIFKIDTSGNVAFLHSFSGSDGSAPYAGLIQANDGNFYGTTYYGGSPGLGNGTVFKMDASGTVTVLHAFSNFDGELPFGGLVQGSDGNFYGTTLGGGTWGLGTVFRIDPMGHLSVLHSFNGSDGAGPEGSLIQAKDGNFYGTTSGGGAYVAGTVFKMDSLGNVTVLHSFSGADGANPYAGVTQGTDGNLYGTTQYGGPSGAGVVFRLDLMSPTGP